MRGKHVILFIMEIKITYPCSVVLVEDVRALKYHIFLFCGAMSRYQGFQVSFILVLWYQQMSGLSNIIFCAASRCQGSQVSFILVLWCQQMSGFSNITYSVLLVDVRALRYYLFLLCGASRCQGYQISHSVVLVDVRALKFCGASRCQGSQILLILVLWCQQMSGLSILPYSCSLVLADVRSLKCHLLFFCGAGRRLRALKYHLFLFCVLIEIIIGN